MITVQVVLGVFQVPVARQSKYSTLPLTSEAWQWSMDSLKRYSCQTSRGNIWSSSSTLWTCEFAVGWLDGWLVGSVPFFFLSFLFCFLKVLFISY